MATPRREEEDGSSSRVLTVVPQSLGKWETRHDRRRFGQRRGIKPPNPSGPKKNEKEIWPKKQLAQGRCSNNDNLKKVRGNLHKVEGLDLKKVMLASEDKKKWKLSRSCHYLHIDCTSPTKLVTLMGK